MGALLADATLQAGLNYRTVVQPRVARVLTLWPNESATSDIVRLIEAYGPSHVLNWKHEEKLHRFVHLVTHISAKFVETVSELSVWIEDTRNADDLLRIRGIGQKTVDYLRNLSGIPTVAVDRHIRAFVESAGISCGSYDQVRVLVEDAATFLHLSPSTVDHAIWIHRSSSR